jgi:hypothetical protein
MGDLDVDELPHHGAFRRVIVVSKHTSRYSNRSLPTLHLSTEEHNYGEVRSQTKDTDTVDVSHAAYIDPVIQSYQPLSNLPSLAEDIDSVNIVQEQATEPTVSQYQEIEQTISQHWAVMENSIYQSEDSGDDDQSKSHSSRTCSQWWTKVVERNHRPITWFLQLLTSLAARNPKRTVAIVTAVSLTLLVAGFYTNFYIEVNEGILYTPVRSLSLELTEWTSSKGYEGSGRVVKLLFHAEGGNVLGQKQAQRMFDAYDIIKNLDGYDASCAKSWFYDSNGDHVCETRGPIQFWDASVATFEALVSSDEDVMMQMSVPFYPDGYPAIEDQIFGQAERSETKNVDLGDGKYASLLTNVKSFNVDIVLSYHWSSARIEKLAVAAMLDLDQQWRKQDGDEPLLLVDISTGRSFGDEFTRGLYMDLPLGM